MRPMGNSSTPSRTNPGLIRLLGGLVALSLAWSLVPGAPDASAASQPQATPMCRPSRDIPERNRQTGSGVPTESDTVQETLIVGDTVYFVGPFTHVADAAGSNKQPRSTVAACSISTGTVLPFVADSIGYMNWALAQDGTRLFVAGEFTSVNGVPRPGLAAVDQVTGAVLA